MGEELSKNTLIAALISILILSVAINYVISTTVLKTGPQGEIGDTGSKGPTGDIGLTGSTGATGVKGSTGSKGSTGATGPKGDKGNTGVMGPKGDRGSTGSTGARGPEGDKGEPGGVEAYVSALLDSEYYDVWGTDYHVVEGFIINFGTDYAYSVTLKVTWRNYDGGSYTELAQGIGNMKGHEIREYSYTFYFEGGYDYITWEIDWN